MSAPAAIRLGGAADLPAVMTVMERAFDPAFGEAWTHGQCLGMMALDDVWLMLAEREGGPTPGAIGFALSRLLVDDAELLLLAVAPAARGGGVGAALIERTSTHAAAAGARRLLLETREGNAAIGLYTRVGFVRIGRRPDYYRGADGRMCDALTLARPIG